MKEFKLQNCVIIVERDEDIFVGHLDRQAHFADRAAKSILRELLHWSDLESIERSTGAPLPEIHKVIFALQSNQLLTHRYQKRPAKEIIISHFNEVGALLASYFTEMGFVVSTIDDRSVTMADVRGQLLRLSDVGLSYQQILAAQRRELINSGNSERANYSSNPNHSERMCSGEEGRADTFMIVTAYPEPELLAQLMEDGTEYLCILTTATGVQVGPWVKPGYSPCFHCIELHLSDLDPHWQLVAATLFAHRYQRLEPAHALAAAALLLVMDGFWNGSEISHGDHARIRHHAFSPGLAPALAGNVESEQRWPFHPTCSCHWMRIGSTRAS